MGQVKIRDDTVSLDDPVLVEGLPGLGLASKIAVDHLIERLDMTYYASIDTDGLPPVAIFEADRHAVWPPVRVYASAEHDLLALTSDVLVSPLYADGFAETVIDWVRAADVTPLFLSGLPSDAEEKHIYGVSTGEAGEMLDAAGITPPDGPGLVGGPTGALLHVADEHDVDALGLIVDTDPQFPDPTAARALIDDGIERLTDIDIATEVLTSQAEQIRDQKEQLAEMIRQAEQHERSQAFPEGMYQ